MHGPRTEEVSWFPDSSLVIGPIQAGKFNMPKYSKFLLLLFCVAFISCMARTYRDEMQSEVETLKDSTKQIDKRYDNKFEILSDKINKVSVNLSDLKKTHNQNKADADVMIEDLRVEIQTLKGRVEEAEHNFSQEENTINKSLRDLDDRMSELESKFDIILAHLNKLQNILGGKKSSSRETAKTSSDIGVYDAIMKIITVEKNFDLAAKKFRSFIKKYPSSPLTDNAQYWLAECYYAQGQYSTAEREFKKLITEYPKSDKRCGAILKRSFALDELKQKSKSTQLLKTVVNECPDTTEAKMAQKKLRSNKKTPAKTR